MRVSFYTMCMGRLQHLRETLPRNLADSPNAEFVVFDYNLPDELAKWSHPVVQEFDAGQSVGD